MWVSYEYTAWSTQLCLYDVKCGSNESRASVEVIKDSENSDYRPESFNHTARSNVTYECGLGRRFQDAASVWKEEFSFVCQDTV